MPRGQPNEKTKAKAKNKGGRPKKEIDYQAVEKLASMMCTQEEIASYLDVCVRTLQRDAEFCRVYKKGLEKGKMSLRRNQYKMSETNPTMAIWLGKQYLEQSDKDLSTVEKIKAETEFVKLKTKLLQGDEKDVEKLKLIMQALGGD